MLQTINDIKVTRNLTLAHAQITIEEERKALERGLHDINHVNRTAELGM